MTNDLKLRLLSSAVGIPVIIFCILKGGPFLLVLLGVIILFSQHEFYTMARAKGYRPNLLLGFTGGLLFLITGFKAGQAGMEFALAVYLFSLFLWQALMQQGSNVISRISVTLIGAIYIGFTLPHLYLIRNVNHGEVLAIMVVVGTWISDTSGYFFGTLFGKHRLAPSISPNKSLEGSGAAIIFTMLIFFSTILIRWMEIMPALTLGFTVGISAQLGDLFESLIKRDFGVKDSGSIIPGHGGFLDRFDSLIFTSLVSFYVITLLKF